MKRFGTIIVVVSALVAGALFFKKSGQSSHSTRSVSASAAHQVALASPQKFEEPPPSAQPVSMSAPDPALPTPQDLHKSAPRPELSKADYQARTQASRRLLETSIQWLDERLSVARSAGEAEDATNLGLRVSRLRERLTALNDMKGTAAGLNQ